MARPAAWLIQEFDFCIVSQPESSQGSRNHPRYFECRKFDIIQEIGYRDDRRAKKPNRGVTGVTQKRAAAAEDRCRP